MERYEAILGDVYDRGERKTITAVETAQRLNDLVTAVSATFDALDGLYGASKGETIPYFTLTPDRKKALDKARVAVHKVIGVAIEVEKRKELGHG